MDKPRLSKFKKLKKAFTVENYKESGKSRSPNRKQGKRFTFIN